MINDFVPLLPSFYEVVEVKVALERRVCVADSAGTISKVNAIRPVIRAETQAP